MLGHRGAVFCDVCGNAADPIEGLGESGRGTDGEFHDMCWKCQQKFAVQTCVNCYRWTRTSLLDEGFECPDCRKATPEIKVRRYYEAVLAEAL